MSTLPRPTGKELVRALERAGFVVERTRGTHYFLRHRMDERPSYHIAAVHSDWAFCGKF